MPGDAPIVLYGEPFWVSPYVFSCFVALREKRLRFETKIVSLARGEHREAGYRDRALTAKVPALVHGEFWLAESSAIVEYLEEVFPAPDHPRVLPADPHDRARARQIMAWIRSDLLPLREERPTNSMFYPRPLLPLSPAAQAAADKLLRAADLLIANGATSLFGAWCVADGDLAFVLQRLIRNGHGIPAKLRIFAAAQWERPSVRAFVEHDRPRAFEPYD